MLGEHGGSECGEVDEGGDPDYWVKYRESRRGVFRSQADSLALLMEVYLSGERDREKLRGMVPEDQWGKVMVGGWPLLPAYDGVGPSWSSYVIGPWLAIWRKVGDPYERG